MGNKKKESSKKYARTSLFFPSAEVEAIYYSSQLVSYTFLRKIFLATASLYALIFFLSSDESIYNLYRYIKYNKSCPIFRNTSNNSFAREIFTFAKVWEDFFPKLNFRLIFMIASFFGDYAENTLESIRRNWISYEKRIFFFKGQIWSNRKKSQKPLDLHILAKWYFFLILFKYNF